MAQKFSEFDVTQEIPVLPLRDVVVFPYMVLPLFVGRQKSIKSLNQSMASDQKVLLVAQKDPTAEQPSIDDLYTTGTIASILQLLKLPDGTNKVLVEGWQRCKVEKFQVKDEALYANVKLIPNEPFDEAETEGLVRTLLSQFDQYVKLNPKIPAEVIASVAGIDDIGRVIDTVAAHIQLPIEKKQAILEANNLPKRLQRMIELLEAELDLMQVEKRVRTRVKDQMEGNHREYYLNEQMKAIQKELGDLGDEDKTSDLGKIEIRIKEAGMSKDAEEKAITELSKMRMMSPMSAEATVSRNYLDWLIDLPWKKRSKVKHDLQQAELVLDADHYGLDKVKERILEYLAVTKRVRKLKGPILCLVGPPGVGKTSLGKSIAKATGRKFARFSLGGVRDEAEIRGHRRTYIGSMPGKILQKLSKVKTRNPLFLLDEIDKMAMDSRGDPASALLEVLDPEQNHSFNDHYLEVDYDLSDVMFVATANTLNIPEALLDRMEVIRLPGYTEDEKLHIATEHLLTKQMEANGLKKSELQISESAIRDIIRYYTREAGVRNLEREISKICRKVIKELVSKSNKREKHTVSARNLEKYLGVKRFRFGTAEEENRVGQVTGLAWTQVGGELLTIEVATVPGKGDVQRTGNLATVMKESIDAAVTVIRTRAEQLGLDVNFNKNMDIHFHVPEGAIKKDGPSAGIAMCTALASSITNIPVCSDVAMTGEITLRGEILPIGGLKEKLLAAHRGGIKRVIIPEENKRDLQEIPDNIKRNLDIRPVRWIDEVLALALQEMPVPKLHDEAESTLPKQSGTVVDVKETDNSSDIA
tara:strand:- start:226565 stop:229006 length:2442 start_codon:yes stop_codon:yes gene_type:complete